MRLSICGNTMEQILINPTWWSLVIACLLSGVIAFILALIMETWLWFSGLLNLIIILMCFIGLAIVNYCHPALGIDSRYLSGLFLGIFVGIIGARVIVIVD